MIKDMVDDFDFPGDDQDEDITPQTVALGATCKHCKSRKAARRKALHRGENQADVLARAKLRRLALFQDINVAVAETDSLSARY